VEAWSKGLQLLKAHPLSGVGFGMFTDFHDITAHNSFVLCFSELGVPGYFLWLTLLVVTLMELNAIQKLPVTTEGDLLLRRLARSVQIGFYGFLVSAWFLSRTYTVTLYLLIALAVSVAEIARRHGKTLGPFSYPAIASRTGAIMVASIVFIYLQIKLQVR
jgi:putative inorganic carbon (HCO3(-)) transporter